MGLRRRVQEKQDQGLALERGSFCRGQREETLAILILVATAQAGLALLPHSLCLAKNRQSPFLKLATKIYSFIWPLPPPEADFQGPAIKVLNTAIESCLLATLINMPNLNQTLYPNTGFSLLSLYTSTCLWSTALYPEAVLCPSGANITPLPYFFILCLPSLSLIPCPLSL